MTRSLIITILVATGSTHALAAPQAPQAAQGQASTTRLVPHSGVLTDAAGQPLTGTHAVTFTLFDHAEGGTVLWTDTITVTADARGRYAAYLGAGQMLPLEHFSSEQARWVEASVNGHAGARAMLVSVPYALKAADAETLGGKPVSSFLTTGPDGKVQRADGTALSGLSGAALDGAAVDGSGVPGQLSKWSTTTTLSSSIITESADNRIGVGLTDPTGGPHPMGGKTVDAYFTIKNLDNNTGFAILNETQQRRFALNTLATGGWLLYDGGTGAWMPGLGQSGGRVGIGIITPVARLDVRAASGPAIFGSSNGGRGVEGEGFNSGTGVIGFSDGTGRAIWGNNLSGSGFAGYFAGRGYVAGDLGVGTENPLDKVHVNGNLRVNGCIRDGAGTVISGVCSSDFRFKKNITPFTSTLAKLSQLQPVHFDWRADEFPDRNFGASRSFGLIAQDVEAVLPELVTTDDTGYRAVKYSELPFHMLQAIKELKTENDALKVQLKSQEDRLRRLETLAGK